MWIVIETETVNNDDSETACILQVATICAFQTGNNNNLPLFKTLYNQIG